MEYLTSDEELQARLRRGINDEWTVVHHFFFDFNVSKDMRNNFEGFIRSLLYQLTKDLKPADLRGVEPEDGWSLRTLEERLKIIVDQHSNPICILLDGLDEYQGNKWDLAHFLRKTASSEVKLCVASRPHQVFNTAFEEIPNIKMHEWNSPAIDKMVTLSIQRDVETAGFYNHEEVVELAKGISEKAQGVFLWARFAIEELRDGWSERIALGELQKRLENVPEELEGIYARIFRKLRPEQRRQAAYMLQLVCYAKSDLTLRELYVATEYAVNGKLVLKSQISVRDIQDFEKRILAVTGGVLEVFPNSEGDSSEEDDSSEGVDYLGIHKDEMLVNVIHRTVRSYLETKNSQDSSGWFQVLGAAHEGPLHAQVLWLRACAANFPPSFRRLPPVNPPSLPSSDAQLSPKKPPGNHKGSDTNEEVSPLLKYAAMYMMHHAADVEQVVKLPSYTILQPSMSLSFLRYHGLYWKQRCFKCIGFFPPCPAPLHPLHLAIAHGLEVYVKKNLSVTKKNHKPGSREWDDVFYLELDDYYREGFPGSYRMSLLEFAIYHASKWSAWSSPVSQTRILALLLEQYSHAHDAEMSVALQFSSPEIVKLLLRDWPDGKMVLNLNLINSDKNLEEEALSRSGLSKLLKGNYDVGPMWFVARRVHEHTTDENAELIDLFVRRGEDINAQCGPVGTALHSVFFHLAEAASSFDMMRLLVAKGANVNASGPLGTPLEFVWRLANTMVLFHGARIMRYTRVIRWLIKSGAVNNRCDPNGSVPSRERMLSFGAGGYEGFRKSQALYRGDPIEDETDNVGKTANA